MKTAEAWDVVVIGAGPAGLAAACAASDQGARVCVIEREERPGGILKQCIHDGFGLLRYGEKLTGPEYAWRDVKEVRSRPIALLTSTFVLELKHKDRFHLTLQSSVRGIFGIVAQAVVIATGCRERTAKQVAVHGTRPAGVYTAGLVQRMINIHGWMPGQKCVILGSGDIGLIMARRLTLEGAEVLGVYEIKREPSGLARNIAQCLHDYQIPLHLGTTVTEVHGEARVEGVTVAEVDENSRILPNTAKFVPCDTLVLAVGLIPENDILHGLGVEFDPRTGGPAVDHLMHTNVPGLFSCGNALHVYDLVDYVSQSGERAGHSAALFAAGALLTYARVPIEIAGALSLAVPRFVAMTGETEVVLYFRSKRVLRQATIEIGVGEQILVRQRIAAVVPQEMGRVVMSRDSVPAGARAIHFRLEG